MTYVLVLRQFNTGKFGTSQLLKGQFGTMIRNTVKIKMDLRVIVSPKCENAVSRHCSLANAFFDIIFNIANSITHSWVRVTSKALVTEWTRLGKYRNEGTSCYAWNMNKVRKVIFWVPDFALSRFPKVTTHCRAICRKVSELFCIREGVKNLSLFGVCP